MNAELLRDLKRDFGTVSGQTEKGGIVAVRNKTHRKLLVELVGNSKVGGRLVDVTSGWPRLVSVVQNPPAGCEHGYAQGCTACDPDGR